MSIDLGLAFLGGFSIGVGFAVAAIALWAFYS